MATLGLALVLDAECWILGTCTFPHLHIKGRVLRLDDHRGGGDRAVEGDGGGPVEVDREASGFAVGHGDGAGGIVLRERVGQGHVLVGHDALRQEAVLDGLADRALRQREIHGGELFGMHLPAKVLDLGGAVHVVVHLLEVRLVRESDLAGVVLAGRNVLELLEGDVDVGVVEGHGSYE